MKLELIRPTLEETWGIMLGADSQLIEPGMKRNFDLATDAQPSLVTTASSGIPFWLSTFVDPEVIRVLQAPNAGAEILGEQKEGDWTTQTATFMVVENTGFVGPYGDFDTNGRSDANVTWTNRQSYLFQTIVEYGDLQVDRAGLARLNWVGELQTSAALTLDKFLDYSYHFGIAGLMNYGLLNDPSLPAALVPSVKAAGGSKWINNGAIVATANEIYSDIQALILDIVTRSAGLFKEQDAATLVMPPQARVALTATNVYGINVYALLKENYPNLKIVTSYRYATTAGNVVQLWADRFQGNKTGICAFVEKLRDHQIVRDLSAYRQKKTSGTWGAIIRYPVAVSQMLGV